MQAALNNVRESMQDLRNRMSAATSSDFGDGQLLEQMRGELGAGATPRTGHQANQLATMVTLLNAEPAGPSRDFLIERFTFLNDVIFYNFGSGELAALDNDQFIAGVYDEIFDGSLATGAPYLPKLVSYVDNIDYNRLGSSQFQGVVYTHGFVHSDHEVSVKGAMVARANGSQSPQTVSGTDMEPGDVFLGDGSKMTYVESFFNSQQGSNGASWSTVLWMGR